MAARYIDYLKAFHKFSKRHKLTASARSMMMALYGEFNEAQWTEELSFSDEEMAMLVGVNRRETIRDAKNILKEYGWIDFRRGKNRVSVYKLLSGNVPVNLAANLAVNLAGSPPDNLAAVPKDACAKTKTKTKTSPPKSPQGDGAFEGGVKHGETRAPKRRGNEPWLAEAVPTDVATSREQPEEHGAASGTGIGDLPGLHWALL